MKLRIIFVIVPALILTGCIKMLFVRQQVFEDDFRNSTKKITRMILQPVERKTEIGMAYIIFERDLSNRFDNNKIYCVISRSSSSFTADNQAFIKADSTNYEITLSNIISEYRSDTETTSSLYTTIDSTSITSGSFVSSDTNNWIDEKFTITPGKEIIASIKNADNLLLRFYFGPIPVTYRIKGSNLKLLKETLSDS